uniref:Zgc:85936 n=1 Tax=Sander lucioperca TaxID=283035 RepID=A0A8D0B3F7_SANLU
MSVCNISLFPGRYVQLLLSQGACPDGVGSNGVAAIHLAAGKETEKNTRCLKMLLQYGADPNIRSSDGLTPIHIAALWGCYQNLNLLLLNGGNPNIKDAVRIVFRISYNRLSGMDTKMHHSQDWNNASSHWSSEGPSILSSTRMSAVGHAAAMPTLEEDLFTEDGVFPSKANEHAATTDGRISPSRRDTLPAFPSRRVSRKSVSFRDVDEYFPCTNNLHFDMSEYPDFLDSERMATVLHMQGIDVTSPDHVYVFCRESSGSTEEELEKTVISHCALEESDDEQEGEHVKEAQVNIPEQPACFHVGSSSSGTGSSHYSSLADTPLNDAAEALHENVNLPFTPSPFVTGRTRSRLSRCSLRTSRTPESLLFMSSLFEETLPTPVRTRRQTPRSQSSEDFYSSPHAPCYTPSYSGNSQGGDSLNLAEIILAMQGNDLAESRDFLTDDLTSTDEATTKRNLNVDCSSDSVSSSSSSTYFSPRRSREDSDLPCTPGTGCTPRYSMSRLSNCRRPQHLANLSYTPGGRPLIQDLDEPVEYLYTDSEQGHKLIETHVPPTANTSLKDMLLPETKGITDKELRLRLVELGESPGPISCRTRPTYILSTQLLTQQVLCSHFISVDLGYSPELCRALRTFELPDCQADEQALCQQFDQPDQNRKWREGIIKSSFNYLLLDPRVTKNLPFRSHTMTPQECFQTFIHAIFYVGKGKRSRPYSHLYEALEYFKGDKTSKKLCPKVQHILQVWTAEQGVISLHCFQNVIPVEAYTREACMVEAIGLKMLTNRKRGDFYGVVSNWQAKKKRDLGVHLLYRAMQIFLAEGERQLRPADIRQ